MQNYKCNNCGSVLQIDPDAEFLYCEYCGCAIDINEGAKKAQGGLTTNKATNSAQTIVNNYYSYSTEENVKSPSAKNNIKSKSTIPERPKVNMIIATVCFFFYVFPGFIYLSYIKKQQAEWDNKYNRGR